MPTIFTKLSRRAEIEEFIRSLPEMLAGKVPDVYGIVRGFKLRVAFAFFSIIKEQFIIKSRGGTDEAGIKWPPLSPEYLAYTRPMASSPGRGSRRPPQAGGRAPGNPGNDGFMTEGQLAQWRAIFRGKLAALSLQMSIGDAKAQAAQIAWATMKKRGVRTKLEVFGNREVEILRDRGILFNSLSPGVLTVVGPDATYSQPTGEGGEMQVVEQLGDGLLCGTNVEYAARHHFGRRPFWPVDGNLPEAWLVECAEVGSSGIEQVLRLFAA